MKPRRPFSGCLRRRDARAPPRAPGAARPLAAGRAARGGPAFKFPRGGRARPRRIPGGRGVGTALSPPARGQRGGRGWRPLPPTRAHRPLHPRLLSEATGGGMGTAPPPSPSCPLSCKRGCAPSPQSREPLPPAASPSRPPQARGALGAPVCVYITCI